MKVLVVGAGLGGLGLANRLVGAGIEVGVRERDAGVEARFQGYRVGIGGDGLVALERCLPARLHQLLHAVGGDLAGVGRVVDSSLNVVGELPLRHEGTLFDRHVLRHLLLTGLGDRVEFGKGLVGYDELADGRVRVRYADGTVESADLVVGADGLGSAVRRRLVPAVRVHALDRFTAIGRTPLTDRFARLVPGWSTVVTTPDLQLMLGKMPFRRPPREAAAELAPDVRLPATPSYLRWVLMIPAGHPGDFHGLEGDADAALEAILELIEGWHPELRELIRWADRHNSGIWPLRVGDPVPPWPTGRVTLLGDAAHPVPPGGLGASLAFLDADLLAGALVDVRDGAVELGAALAGYERTLRERGAYSLGQAMSTFRTFDELRKTS